MVLFSRQRYLKIAVIEDKTIQPNEMMRDAGIIGNIRIIFQTRTQVSSLATSRQKKRVLNPFDKAWITDRG
jgi:hypothetical protein